MLYAAEVLKVNYCMDDGSGTTNGGQATSMDGVPGWRPPVESVNFHVWLPCNMRCKFCFGRFDDVRLSVLPKGHLARHDAIRLVDQIASAGFTKITFAGGEPLLCPWLPDLVIRSSNAGLTTSVVTNGSVLDERRMSDFMGTLDWMTLSFDSASTATLAHYGRAVGRRPMSEEDYLRVVNIARVFGSRIKINTVITAQNASEDLTQPILRLRPERWKILQVLKVGGQNNRHFDQCRTTASQFWQFVERHRHLAGQGITIVPEDNAAMTGSYVMVDPAGRFFDNVDGAYRYSSPILDRGVAAAFSEVRVSRKAFMARGGVYDWAT